MPVLRYAPSELKARRLSVDGGKTEDDEVGGEDGGRGRLPQGWTRNAARRQKSRRRRRANNSRERAESQLARYAPGTRQ